MVLGHGLAGDRKISGLFFLSASVDGDDAHDDLGHHNPRHHPSECVVRIVRVQIRRAGVVDGSQQDADGIDR